MPSDLRGLHKGLQDWPVGGEHAPGMSVLMSSALKSASCGRKEQQQQQQLAVHVIKAQLRCLLP